MENGLAYTFKLATESAPSKQVKIVFSTEGMMALFLRNLFEDFITSGVPSNNGLDLCLYVPEEGGKENE